MNRILISFLAVLAFSPLQGLAEDLAAAALEGAWVVSVGEGTRDRFLIVKGARTEKDRVLVDSAVYGWIDGKGKKVGNWKADIFGDTIKLAYVTPADSQVNVTFKSTDTSASGDFTSKAGKKFEVRMTRLDDEELAAMRAAAASAKSGQTSARTGAVKSSKISLAYVGADDCPSCRGFIGSVGKDGKGLKRIAPELAEARFVYVHLWSFRDPVTAGGLPPDLQWLMQPAANGKPRLRKRGRPFFAAVLDQRAIAQGHGVAALETIVAPAIRRAVEERRAAN